MSAAHLNGHAPADAPSSPTVQAGLSTYFGFGAAVLSSVGALVAAIESNDTAMIAAGAAGVLLALGTIGGRMAQALVIARQAAVAVEPFVDALAYYADPASEDVAPEELPDDAEEFGLSPSADGRSPQGERIAS